SSARGAICTISSDVTEGVVEIVAAQHEERHPARAKLVARRAERELAVVEVGPQSRDRLGRDVAPRAQGSSAHPSTFFWNAPGLPREGPVGGCKPAGVPRWGAAVASPGPKAPPMHAPR